MTFQTTKIQPKADGEPDIASRAKELQVGTVLWGRYEVREVLGSSALGELWRCLDRESGQDISLRWLPPDLRRSKQVMAVIHAGIRRIADQSHPNLAAIRQMVYVGDQIYLVGDFAPGTDIGTWCRAGVGGKRTLEEVLPKLQQVASGLDFAHEHRIVHRNLKPSNIFVEPDGVVRVTDFGLTPHHHLTIVHGEAIRSSTTGPYLAPELKDGEEADSASDQYALAVLALDLLAGEAPGEETEPPHGLPGSARAALRRAMAKTPRSRYVTCEDFVRALGGEHVGGRRKRSAAEWRRIMLGVEVLAALLILGSGFAFGLKPLVAWMNKPKEAPVADEALVLPLPLEKKKTQAPELKAAPRLVATTPLPVQGQPWVTQTGRMEFVWVPMLQMWVGRFEVTNEEYRQKEAEHDSGLFRELPLNDPRQPAVRLNFDDTAAYADWLTEQERTAGKLPEGWRYRLPSRLEAITYTRTGGAQAFPWGELWPPTRGNYADTSLRLAFSDLPAIEGYQDGFSVTAPVDFSGENGWGLFGAGGNVWETTAKEAGAPQFGGWQGGGWDDYQLPRIRCDTLYGFLGNARGAVNGFRLVLAPIAGEAPPPEAAPAPPQS